MIIKLFESGIGTAVLGKQAISQAITQTVPIALFALLTAAGAQIQIPHNPVPFTLQTFFVILSGAMLRGKSGMMSQLLYLSLGIAGLPVFTAGAFGAARLLGPSGGFLLGFPIAAFLVGYLIEKRAGYWWSAFSMAAGMVSIYIMGTLFLYTAWLHDLKAAVVNGALIFSLWDGVKLMAAAGIYSTVRRFKK